VKTVSSGLQGLLDGRRFPVRELLKMTISGVERSFWTGEGPYTYNGIVYQAGGSIIKIAPISAQRAGYASSIQVFMSSIPNTRVTPEVLSGIFQEDYRNQPIQIMRASFDPVSWALSDVRTRWKGKIDRVSMQAAPDDQARLIFHCVSREMDAKKTGYRIRSEEDQRLIDLNDRFFQYAGVVDKQTVFWGKQRVRLSGGDGQRNRGRKGRR
jgi:hypothetical protein